MATGYIFDERFLGHDTGERLYQLPSGEMLEPVEHSSAMRITRRTHALIAGSGLLPALTRLPARMASEDDVALYHTREHIARVREVCAAGGGEAGYESGESTPVVPASWDAALLSAGSGMAAVDAVMAGTVDNVYALVRPPGHHATADQSMGFCVFNNVVIAARHAQRQHGLRRVMIIDWDVHHGNGTQAAFYGDPDVLFVSLHQDDWYPLGWGLAEHSGEGAAAGRTVNIPLPAGTGNRGYLEAFDRVIDPIARQFAPELILVSAGQDANMYDPLARMMVTMDGYRDLTERVMAMADRACGGRLVILQEGGYSAAYVPFCTLAVVEALAGRRSEARDPSIGTSELDRSQRAYGPDQTAAIDEVIRVQSDFWRF